MNTKNGSILAFFYALSIVALMITPGKVTADQNLRKIKLAWDSNTEPDLQGYNVYYKCCLPGPPYEGKEAYEGDSPIAVYLTDLKNTKNPKYELNGLSKQNEYFFSITAFDSEGNESGFSNETSTVDVSPARGGGGGGSGGGCFIENALH